MHCLINGRTDKNRYYIWSPFQTEQKQAMRFAPLPRQAPDAQTFAFWT